MNNASLVLEGGTFRTIFTSGILDAFLEHTIEMPYVIGISAGAINACSYVSKQPERTFRTISTYRNDPRYMGWRNFLTEKSYFGLNFSYNILPNKLDFFDWQTFREFSGEVEFGVTNALTGEAEYLDALTMDDECMMLRATCALPVLFPEIKINDIPYFDGGLADAVPIKRAEEKGYTKHIIILTRPPGYRKALDGQSKWVMRAFKKRYPEIAKSLATRAERYNATMEYIEQLEADGKAFVFRPPVPVASFEKNPKIMKITYDLGYRQMLSRKDDLLQFLQS
ncbi:MAG TPA: patatin family protein [Metalysinibacillus sp.]